MRGRCDNPKCCRPFGLQPVHGLFRKFCSLACKKQFKSDQRHAKRERRAVRTLYSSALRG